MSRKRTQAQVSPNNPCPFLRALVAQGQLPDVLVPIGQVTKVIVDVARAGDGHPTLPSAAICAIALIANGVGPRKIASNAMHGVRLNELRHGPLDKRGAGSRILDVVSRVNEAELDRLVEFASEKCDLQGIQELGLDKAELTRMMDANFQRAAGRRRKIDRRLMDGEWPVLLTVMGKEGTSGRYLSVAEVRDLFVARRLPERMNEKLDHR